MKCVARQSLFLDFPSVEKKNESLIFLTQIVSRNGNGLSPLFRQKFSEVQIIAFAMHSHVASRHHLHFVIEQISFLNYSILRSIDFRHVSNWPIEFRFHLIAFDGYLVLRS